MLSQSTCPWLCWNKRLDGQINPEGVVPEDADPEDADPEDAVPDDDDPEDVVDIRFSPIIVLLTDSSFLCVQYGVDPFEATFFVLAGASAVLNWIFAVIHGSKSAKCSFAANLAVTLSSLTVTLVVFGFHLCMLLKMLVLPSGVCLSLVSLAWSLGAGGVCVPNKTLKSFSSQDNKRIMGFIFMLFLNVTCFLINSSFGDKIRCHDGVSSLACA